MLSGSTSGIGTSRYRRLICEPVNPFVVSPMTPATASMIAAENGGTLTCATLATYSGSFRDKVILWQATLPAESQPSTRAIPVEAAAANRT